MIVGEDVMMTMSVKVFLIELVAQNVLCTQLRTLALLDAQKRMRE